MQINASCSRSTVYGASPAIPKKGWDNYTIWQYKSGDHPNNPNRPYENSTVPGVDDAIHKGCDVDSFNDKTLADLEAFWHKNEV